MIVTIAGDANRCGPLASAGGRALLCSGASDFRPILLGQGPATAVSLATIMGAPPQNPDTALVATTPSLS